LERELSDARKKPVMGGGAKANAANGSSNVRIAGDVEFLERAKASR
jgi:hypothetical protein